MFDEIKKTSRGFELIKFDDANSHPCTLQQSSAMDDRGAANPGSSYIWLGKGDERMHLHRDQVRELIARLDMWLATGSFK